MAIAFVQSARTDTGVVAYGSNNTAGNLLVACIGDAADIATVTDTSGNTPVKATDGGDSFLWGDIWYVENCLSGANTVTGGTRELIILEYSGIATSSALDQAQCSARGNVGLGQQPDSGNVTTTQADELLIGSIAVQDAHATTWGSSFTELYEIGGAFRGVTAADRTVSSTGTYKATATLDAGEWFCMIATFKAAGGGGGGVFDQTYFYRMVGGM